MTRLEKILSERLSISEFEEIISEYYPLRYCSYNYSNGIKAYTYELKKLNLEIEIYIDDNCKIRDIRLFTFYNVNTSLITSIFIEHTCDMNRNWYYRVKMLFPNNGKKWYERTEIKRDIQFSELKNEILSFINYLYPNAKYKRNLKLSLLSI